MIANKIKWKKNREETSGLSGPIFYFPPHKWIFSSPCMSLASPPITALIYRKILLRLKEVQEIVGMIKERARVSSRRE
jgi:hypothetical protein